MCHMILCEPGATPHSRVLERIAALNNDGHGFAYGHPSCPDIHIERSLNAVSLIAAFLYERARWPHAPMLWHSRARTGGVIRAGNCHPFRLSDGSVLAHNGILFDIALNAPRCDSRIYAEDIHDGSTATLRKFFGRFNKAVILRPDGTREIVNEDGGTWQHGCWYSNMDFLWAYNSSPRETYQRRRELAWAKEVAGRNARHCGVCGAQNTIGTGYAPVQGICMFCRACAGCLNHFRECRCTKTAGEVTAPISREHPDVH